MPKPNYEENRQWCLDRASSHYGTVEFTKDNITTCSKIIWRCEHGHDSWSSTINNMKSKNTWCPMCTLNITEKYIVYALNQLFGEEYIFRTKQLECLKERKNINCDLVNEELGLYIEVDGWASHGDNKDKDLMNLQRRVTENPEEEYDDRHKFKDEKIENLIRIPHQKYETFESIGGKLYDILVEKFNENFIITKEELLDNIPNKAEIVRHYHNRKKREVEEALESKGIRLHEFKFTRTPDATISVYCSKCDTNTKLWSYHDIVRTDKNQRKLICNDCCPTTKLTDTKLEEFCQEHGFTYRYKEKKGHDNMLYVTCKNGTDINMLKGNMKRGYRCKCSKCK